MALKGFKGNITSMNRVATDYVADSAVCLKTSFIEIKNPVLLKKSRASTPKILRKMEGFLELK